MRTIRKGKEPAAWIEFRSRSDASFDATDAPKDELRRALVQEQGGLCCYCLGRIKPLALRMKIEHWAPQSRYPARRLDYGNVLGACMGGEGSPPSQQHCDTAKGDTELTINPAAPGAHCSESFSYLVTGEIKPSRNDADLAQDIETLALNLPRIIAGRRAQVDAIRDEVRRTKGNLSREKLQRMATKLEEPDARGNLKPYCQAAIFWLRRQA